MNTGLEIIDIGRIRTQPYPCSYLPGRQASLEYRIVAAMTSTAYGELLRRGWRRFGRELFRPVCRSCAECRSLRILVPKFRPSKSQRRTLSRNSSIRVITQAPTVTSAHLELFNNYHRFMTETRGWAPHQISENEYEQAFVVGGADFAREFLYYDDDRLVGVGLADVVPDAVSSVYFYHAPDWRQRAPGVFSLVRETQMAAQLGLPYHYLGYWIRDCDSMSYKANYRPHELIADYVDDDEAPRWITPREN